MDKTWIKASIGSEIFKVGVKAFINFARREGEIPCPCNKCCLQQWFDCDTVHGHILVHGFLVGYTTWTFHGELMTSSKYDTPYMRNQESHSQSTSVQKPPLDSESVTNLLQDVILGPINEDREMSRILGCVTKNVNQHVGANPVPNNEAAQFQKLLDESKQELYEGTSYSRLAFVLQLYHIKCLGCIANKYFDMLLELLIDVFPFLNSLPSNTYEVKKMIKPLGLNYEKIKVCPNDCMLYWGSRENDTECYVCHTKKPIDKQKILRYFPLIPRLRRLYSSSKTAEDMRWHFMGRTKDGKLRHPADGLSWQAFDARYPEFASDSRSIRLSLSSDGVSPNRTMSTTYSVWPVMLVPYNLPPWLCMKQPSLILSMIIPGPKGPGNNIDLYLQPLIKELQLLWEGVDAYDAYAKKNFKLRAALCGTISDFPAYANLSGWSTKGRVACPCCTYTKNKKRKPGYIDFFEFTHKNKKGAYAKDKTAFFMDFAKEKMEEYKASGKFPNHYAIQREAWDICMGEDTPGRARGFGVGVTKSQVRGFRAELMDMRNEELAVNHSRSIENHLKDFASYKASTDATIEAMQTELQLYRTAYTNGIDPMSQTFGHNVERSASDNRRQQQQQQQQQANDMVEKFLKEHFGGDEVILSATDSKIKAKQG